MPPTRTSLSGLVSMVTAPFRRGRITGSAIPSGGGPGAGAPVWSYGGSNSGPAGQPGSGWNAAPGNTPDISQFAPTFQPSGSLFSPVYPLVPVERELLRRYDFPTGYNYIYTPRSFEPVSYRQLRALAQEPITRLCIETRKDQIEALEWTIKPIDERRPKAGAEARAEKLVEFFQKPDGYHPFATWLRLLIEDVLVTDAPAIEIRKNRGGGIVSLDYVDGSTFKVLIDNDGRRPLPPAPAYEQVIHGRPWVLAEEGRIDTRDRGKPLFDAQIIYMPRNPRGAHNYGHPPVEQILLTINTEIRRQAMQLAHFTESNLPAGMVNSPDGWSPDQVKQYQDWFDSILSGNLGERTKILWGPAGAKYQVFKEPPFKDDFDEWLARVVCFAFSLPPTPFVRQLNRATAEQAQETALAEGLAPLMGWAKRLADLIIQNRLGHPDLEFSWGDKRPVDPLDQHKMLTGYVKEGLYTRNEARDVLGMDPIPGGENATVEVPGQGIVLVRDLNRGGAEKAMLAKRGRFNPANSPARQRAAVKLRRTIGQFFAHEAARVAEVFRARKLTKADDVDDGEGDDNQVTPVDQDRHRIEALIAAALSAIDFTRWRVMVLPVSALLADLGAEAFAQAAQAVDAPEIVESGKEWAAAWAKKRAAQLVGQKWVDDRLVPDSSADMAITESTPDMLRPVLETAFAERQTLAELVEALRQSPAFSDHRAQRIADFETTQIYHQATLEAFKASRKVDYVTWNTMRDDQVEAICEENADASPIPIGDVFPSGDTAPPAHVDCRCWLAATKR